MLTLAEKIEIAKRCCLTAKEYITERKQAFYAKLFDSKWEVLVVKKDGATGKFVRKFAACARCAA